jgi:hypothetical protein
MSPRVSIMALLALVLFALGCRLFAPAAETGPAPCSEDRATALAIELDAWQEGALHRDGGTCEIWYRTRVVERGELRIDVYAPSGAGIPDFDLRLEDDSAEVLWGFAPTGVSPRSARRVVGPGLYYVRISSFGELGGPLDYELYAAVGVPPARSALGQITPAVPRRVVGASAAQTLAAGSAVASTSAPPSRGPVPAPAAGAQVWLGAGVVEVEAAGHRTSAIWIDAGSDDAMRAGLRGELLAPNGWPFAHFELTDVEAGRSRAKVDRVDPQRLAEAQRVRVRVPLAELQEN